MLAGSSYTSGMLQSSLQIDTGRLRLVHENGIPERSIRPSRTTWQGPRPRILFVGRLVAYKGADVMLKAAALAAGRLDTRLDVTIVGDGPERPGLEALAQELESRLKVDFAGWVPQEATGAFYTKADLFCFPSIREFGGAVVLEAFAAGLPCVVPDYGGIGEYVNSGCGVKLQLATKERLTEDCAQALVKILGDQEYWRRLSEGAVARAREYAWENKGAQMLELYAGCLAAKADESR